jgi:hypothetical protein
MVAIGLFEFLFERKNPAPVGGFENRPEPGRRGNLGLRVAVSLVILSAFYFLLWMAHASVAAVVIWTVGFAAYSAVASSRGQSPTIPTSAGSAD